LVKQKYFTDFYTEVTTLKESQDTGVRLSRNPGPLTSQTPQGHIDLFRGYFTFYVLVVPWWPEFFGHLNLEIVALHKNRYILCSI
jgi:hypothetical protein